jgi:hypothetical protein
MITRAGKGSWEFVTSSDRSRDCALRTKASYSGKSSLAWCFASAINSGIHPSPVAEAIARGMKRLLEITVVGIALSFGVGCASAGSAGSSGAAGGRIAPPEMSSRAPMPELRFPRSAGAGTVSYRMEIDVVIDSTGVPDMSTFKTSGSAASENRQALYDWIQTSTFRPATQDGRPVSAIYHTRMQFRVPGR